MDLLHFTREMTKRTYKAVRILVRTAYVLFFLLVAVYLYLRTFGIPQTILRAGINRAKAAGVLVEVDEVLLTVKGWRAENLRYYSNHPDDVYPIFTADHVYFSLHRHPAYAEYPNAWQIDVEAREMSVNSSVTWGVEIPEASTLRLIDSVDISMDILPDKLSITSAEVNWMGVLFQIRGSILRPPETAEVPEKPPKQETLVPTRITAEDFHEWEEKLKIIQFEQGVVVNLNFLINTRDFAESNLKCSISAPALTIMGVDFTQAKVTGSYHFPEVKLSRAAIHQGHQSLMVTGAYDLLDKELQVNLVNTLTSKELFRLLPASVQQILKKNEVRIDSVPNINVTAGPSPVKEIIQHISGGFVLPSVSYQGLKVERVRAKFESHEGGVDLTELQAVVRGDESMAGSVGSCMKGGPIMGNASWDTSDRQYRVELETYCDPHLAVGALSRIKAVTNIIDMARFKSSPPKLHLEFNEHIGVKGSFDLNGHLTGQDMTFREAWFSSADIPFRYYNRGVVELSPLIIKQGADSASGSVTLDFTSDQVSFDVTSNLNPATLEKIIFPDLGLFNDELKFDGTVSVSASGVFDWGGMTNTLFNGSVNAEKLITPATELAQVSAVIKGAGRLIRVDNVECNIYDGNATGDVSVLIGVGDRPTSYEVDLSIQEADIVGWIDYLTKTNLTTVAGKLYADVHFAADTDKEFLASATGEGSVRVEKGQLADLPFFAGFSKLFRKVYPTFTVFSITQLSGSFIMGDGTIATEDAYFEGDLLSAKARGSYRYKTGLDIIMQAQIFRKGPVGKVARWITDPILKLLEFQIEGDITNPSWRMVKLPKDVSKLFKWSKEKE